MRLLIILGASCIGCEQHLRCRTLLVSARSTTKRSIPNKLHGFGLTLLALRSRPRPELLGYCRRVDCFFHVTDGSKKSRQ